jgi:hypothetical protein
MVPLFYIKSNKAGFHQAQLIGKFKTAVSEMHNSTSPDGANCVYYAKSVLLFTYSLMSHELQLNHFFSKKDCFKDDSTLVIPPMKRPKKIGGYVYEVTLEHKIPTQAASVIGAKIQSKE